MSGSGHADDDSRARVVWSLVLVLVAVGSVSLALAARSWYPGLLAVLALVVLVVGLRSRPMRLQFDVGQLDPHRVAFSFNKVWGNLAITVDGTPVVRDLRVVSVRLTKTYRFTVGAQEAHEVRVEKDRALFLAGVRRQPVRAYVDGVLVAQGAA